MKRKDERKQEFYELLKQVKNKTFEGTRIEIDGSGPDEDKKVDDALDDEKVILLSKALKQNPNITVLNLTNSEIGDEGAKALSRIDTLKELNLYGNNIGVKGAVKLGQSKLKTLVLGANPITYNKTEEATFAQIITMINSFTLNKSIINLDLIYCAFRQEHDDIIAKLIGNNNSIKSLNLTFNYLSDGALKYIANNTTLTSLDLYSNNITDMGCKYIAKNHSLKVLRLNKTKIGDEGAKLLSTHPTLETLDIVDTEITLKGLKSFLGINTNINRVGVRSHKISEKDTHTFYQKFKQFKKLQGTTETICDSASQTVLTGDIDSHTDDSYY